MGLSKTDKIKIRTATKCYLKSHRNGTARQIYDYILNLDLKLNANLTVNNLARDLKYCSISTSRNILSDIDYETDSGNTFHYFLRKDK